MTEKIRHPLPSKEGIEKEEIGLKDPHGFVGIARYPSPVKQPPFQVGVETINLLNKLDYNI